MIDFAETKIILVSTETIFVATESSLVAAEMISVRTIIDLVATKSNDF